jgi:hypothetical protein
LEPVATVAGGWVLVVRALEGCEVDAVASWASLVMPGVEVVVEAMGGGLVEAALAGSEAVEGRLEGVEVGGGGAVLGLAVPLSSAGCCVCCCLVSSWCMGRVPMRSRAAVAAAEAMFLSSSVSVMGSLGLGAALGAGGGLVPRRGLVLGEVAVVPLLVLAAGLPEGVVTMVVVVVPSAETEVVILVVMGTAETVAANCAMAASMAASAVCIEALKVVWSPWTMAAGWGLA